VEQIRPELNPEIEADGDSFGMTVDGKKGGRTKRTYRLYGVDCPEGDPKDPLVKERMEEQAEHFGVPVEQIPAWGKKAEAFTERLLKKGKPKLFTYGPLGEMVQKNKGRRQRYYVLIEVTDQSGKRRWLHELLLEAGLARAHGEPAPWPEKDLERDRENQVRNEFLKDLKKLENKAKRNAAGIWQKGAG
jgi:endonuclease YncB( thermonuclease family)